MSVAWKMVVVTAEEALGHLKIVERKRLAWSPTGVVIVLPVVHLVMESCHPSCLENRYSIRLTRCQYFRPVARLC